jgi:hypothetical protein
MSNSQRSIQHDGPRRRRTTIQDVMWRWVDDGFYTVADLAGLADCQRGTMYAYLEERRNFPFKRVKRIARHASREHGLNGVAKLLLDRAAWEVSPRGSGQADGCLDNDLGPMTEALGLARRRHREGDRAGMGEQIERAEAELNDLKAERDRL